MTLTVKIEIEKSKENYQAVISALNAFDILSASWEADIKVKPPTGRSRSTADDLSGGLSQAIDSVTKRDP